MVGVVVVDGGKLVVFMFMLDMVMGVGFFGVV